MREMLQKFMLGRYGSDPFGRFLSVLSLILVVVAILVKGLAGTILWILGLGLLLYCYFRMLSKNVSKRYGENARYLSYRNQLTGYFRFRRERFRQRKEYRFYDCPQCGVTTRVPRGKGKIRITCPKCGNSFIRKS